MHPKPSRNDNNKNQAKWKHTVVGQLTGVPADNATSNNDNDNMHDYHYTQYPNQSLKHSYSKTNNNFSHFDPNSIQSQQMPYRSRSQRGSNYSYRHVNHDQSTYSNVYNNANMRNHNYDNNISDCKINCSNNNNINNSRPANTLQNHETNLQQRRQQTKRNNTALKPQIDNRIGKNKSKSKSKNRNWDNKKDGRVNEKTKQYQVPDNEDADLVTWTAIKHTCYVTDILNDNSDFDHFNFSFLEDLFSKNLRTKKHKKRFKNEINDSGIGSIFVKQGFNTGLYNKHMICWNITVSGSFLIVGVTCVPPELTSPENILKHGYFYDSRDGNLIHEKHKKSVKCNKKFQNGDIIDVILDFTTGNGILLFAVNGQIQKSKFDNLCHKTGCENYRLIFLQPKKNNVNGQCAYQVNSVTVFDRHYNTTLHVRQSEQQLHVCNTECNEIKNVSLATSDKNENINDVENKELEHDIVAPNRDQDGGDCMSMTLWFLFTCCFYFVLIA